jgi:hypothetical protein
MPRQRAAYVHTVLCAREVTHTRKYSSGVKIEEEYSANQHRLRFSVMETDGTSCSSKFLPGSFLWTA